MSEFARASEFVTSITCKVSEFARATEFVSSIWKMKVVSTRANKNDPLLSLTHWPPLTLMFLGPRALLNTRHVHCFSKKPWCWINAKVKLSVLRCGQVELFLSFRVRFECSRVINVSWQVLYRSLSKISIETLKMKLMIQWCCATRRLKSLFISW